MLLKPHRAALLRKDLGDSFDFQNGRLTVKFGEKENAELQKKFEDSIADNSVQTLHIGGMDSKDLVRIDIIPQTPEQSGSNCVAIFLINFSNLSSREIDKVRLIDHFELTPSEAELAISIAHFYSPRQYAMLRGITLNTARWTLAKVFEKLEVSSQEHLREKVRMFY